MGSKKLEPLMKDAKRMKKLMEESFRKVDIDGNGYLDRGEFEQVLVQIAKEIGVDSPTREEVDDILDEIDENGDNRIDREEFSELIEKVFQMMHNEDNSWFIFHLCVHFLIQKIPNYNPFLSKEGVGETFFIMVSVCN